MNSRNVSKTISENWREEEAQRRLDIITAVRLLMNPEDESKPKLSERKACKKIGVDQATFGRWRKKFDDEGFVGLLPDTHECGRKSVLEKLNVPVDVIKEVQGINLDTESNTAAWRLFAHSDKCPEALARVILDPTRSSKHAIPPSLRSATKLTEPVRDAHRGRRQLDLNGIWIPRYMDVLPGDIFTADDTTPIWAWWVPWYESEEYPFGVKLLQGQFLPIMDIVSQAIICYSLIAREKSSYRAADIWALFGHAFEVIGLPRLGFQLERGSWEANLIRGEEVEYQAGEVSLSRRVGGLRQLPTNVLPWHRERLNGAEFPKTLQTWTSYLPKSKPIEAWFNRSQTLEGTLWGSLGRDQMRRPYEKTKKLFQACQRGAEDPRKHFLSGTEMVTQLNKLIGYLNYEPMEGEVFHGIPQMKLEAAIHENPLFRLPEEQRWLYRRNWKVLQITNGWARVRLTDDITGKRYSLFYENPAVFANMEGEEVVVYFDREKFEEPAQILSARSGEYICEAHYFERKGSFLDGDQSGHDIRKAWRNAVLTTYGTIVQHAPSRQLPAEIEQRRKAEPRQSELDPTPPPPAPLQIDGRPTTVAPRTPQRAALPPTTPGRAKAFSRQAEINRKLREQQEAAGV